MRQSTSNLNKRIVKPPDSIVASKSSLNSSSSSTYSRTTPTPTSSISRNSYRIGENMALSSSVSSNTKNTKLEQIIQNFYSKTAQIITQSRIPNLKSGARRRKINKWFNITTNDSDGLKEDLKFWKSFINYQQEEEPPPLIIDIYVETTEPELLQEGDDTNGWHKLDFGLQQNESRRILIESWTLTLNHPIPDSPVDLPNLYKRSIVFFRSLHSLVRLLPSFKLSQKLRLHTGEITLGYRLSANRSNNRINEISFDHPLTELDTIQLYELKDIVTPLGVFKLNLLYRERCQFGTKEETRLHGTDVEENFFTPTMTKYRQEQSKDHIDSRQATPPVIYPSSSTSSARSRVQSYRSTITPTTNRSNNPIHSTSSNTLNSATAALERRISAPIVSPFKSPSLSSSTQAELMHTSRSHTTDRSRPESTSFGRKTEFSSSFEKFFKSGSSSQLHRTAADMTTYSATRRWSRASDHSSINMDSEEDEEGLQEFMNFIGAKQELKLFQQFSTQLNSHQTMATEVVQDIDNSKSLFHFRNIQEAHTILSDSMSTSQHNLKQSIEPLSQGSYESSSSSLNKQLNLPAIPSPLHNTESHALSHFRKLSEDNRFGDDRRPQTDISKISPLKNRQAPPLPPPPKIPQHGNSVGDEDDSLVFKMSELSGYEENLAQSGHSFYFGSTTDKQNLIKKSSSFTNILSDTTNKKNNHPSSSDTQKHLDNVTRQYFYG